MARSLVSRQLGLRSLVSRNMEVVPECSCLGENDSYNWSDLFGKEFSIRVPVNVYDLPDPNSNVVTSLSPGDSILIHSFVNRNGKTWIMFHLNQVDYDNFNGSYIPLSGNPANINQIEVETIGSVFDPKADDPTLQTTQEIQAGNADFFDKAQTLLSSVLLWGSVFVIGSRLIQSKPAEK